MSGTVQPVAYTAFQLGGHSVLFEDDYRLAMSADSAHALRFNVGSDLTIAVSKQAPLFLVGYRYLGGAERGCASMRPSAILNPNQYPSSRRLTKSLRECAGLDASVAIRFACARGLEGEVSLNSELPG